MCNRGMALKALGRLAEALASLDEAIKLDAKIAPTRMPAAAKCSTAMNRPTSATRLSARAELDARPRI